MEIYQCTERHQNIFESEPQKYVWCSNFPKMGPSEATSITQVLLPQFFPLIPHCKVHHKIHSFQNTPASPISQPYFSHHLSSIAGSTYCNVSAPQVHPVPPSPPLPGHEPFRHLPIPCWGLTPGLCWSRWQKKSQMWPPINKYNSKGRKSL